MQSVKATVSVTMLSHDEDEARTVVAKVVSKHETPCEARNHLKSITEALITLVERGVLGDFSTELNVWREEE